MRLVGSVLLTVGMLTGVPASAAVTAGDSVQWLPRFEATRGAQVVDRYKYSEPCGTGYETWPAPIEFHGSISRHRLVQLGQAIFRSLPPVLAAPQAKWRADVREYRKLDIRFRTGGDSLRVLIDDTAFGHDRCAIWRRRNGVVVDSLVVERMQVDVRFAVFGDGPDRGWRESR